MSIRTSVSLPACVHLQEVTIALGVLHGLPRRRVSLSASSRDRGYYAEVLGAKALPSSSPEMATIHLQVADSDRMSGHRPVALYHFHFEGGGYFPGPVACTAHEECRAVREMGEACWSSLSQRRGRRLLTTAWSPESVVVARALVDFFGGVVDARDDDDEHADHAVPDPPIGVNGAEDGEEWQSMQDRLLALEPVGRRDKNAGRVRRARFA